MSTGASRVLVVLIIALPVIALCLPSISWPLDEDIEDGIRANMSEIHNRTVCPFTVYNTPTGGVPKYVLEYRCLISNGELSNSEGRCNVDSEKVYECIQATTDIEIMFKGGVMKRPFYSGCFCQAKNDPRISNFNEMPSITN